MCWVQMGLVDEVLPEDGDPDVAVAAFVRPFLKPAHSTGDLFASNLCGARR